MIRRRDMRVKCRRKLAGKCYMGHSSCVHAKLHDPMMMPNGKLCTALGRCPAWAVNVSCGFKE